MTYLFHFLVYSLYNVASRVEKKAPVIIVMGWLTVISFFHVCTIFSITTLIFGVNPGYIFTMSKSRMVIALWMSVWGLTLWILLRTFHVKERAFRPDFVKVYKARGYRDWWVVAYIFASFAVMGVTTWYAGRVVRGLASPLFNMK